MTIAHLFIVTLLFLSSVPLTAMLREEIKGTVSSTGKLISARNLNLETAIPKAISEELTSSPTQPSKQSLTTLDAVKRRHGLFCLAYLARLTHEKALNPDMPQKQLVLRSPELVLIACALANGKETIKRMALDFENVRRWNEQMTTLFALPRSSVPLVTHEESAQRSLMGQLIASDSHREFPKSRESSTDLAPSALIAKPRSNDTSNLA